MRIPVVLFLGLSMSVVCGCIDVRVRAGAHPDPQLLEQKLVTGKSTMDDVRSLLGSPFGTGSSMLPIQSGPRTLWSYYFEEGNLSQDRRMFLFVYFTSDDRYEGYLWFSSLPVDQVSNSSAGNFTLAAPKATAPSTP